MIYSPNESQRYNLAEKVGFEPTVPSAANSFPVTKSKPKLLSTAYIDKKGVVKRRGSLLPSNIALSSAFGSPSSSPEIDPVRKISFAT